MCRFPLLMAVLITVASAAATQSPEKAPVERPIASAVEAKLRLEKARYSDVRDIRREAGRYETDAVWKETMVHVHVDAKTGEITRVSHQEDGYND